eukprot:3940497-Rhodomonas_salina.1
MSYAELARGRPHHTRSQLPKSNAILCDLGTNRSSCLAFRIDLAGMGVGSTPPRPRWYARGLRGTYLPTRVLLPGTDLRDTRYWTSTCCYAPTMHVRAMCGTELRMVLHSPCGTERAYGPTTRAVLSERMALQHVQY